MYTVYWESNISMYTVYWERSLQYPNCWRVQLHDTLQANTNITLQTLLATEDRSNKSLPWKIQNVAVGSWQFLWILFDYEALNSLNGPLKATLFSVVRQPKQHKSLPRYCFHLADSLALMITRFKSYWMRLLTI